METSLHQPAARAEAFKAIWELLEEERLTSQKGLSSVELSKSHSHSPTINNEVAFKILKRGISSRVIGPLSEFLGLGRGVVAKHLGTNRSTVNRMVQKDQLLPTHAAESVLRFLELDQMAMNIFASEKDASKWLRQPHPMLEGDTPLDAAETSVGTTRVKDILQSIKFGGVV